MLNRHILSQAPASAIAMLEYKAAEAGIPFARISADEHKIALGRAIHTATKTVRKAKQKIARTIKEGKL
jgi:hypothetical protein